MSTIQLKLMKKIIFNKSLQCSLSLDKHTFVVYDSFFYKYYQELINMIGKFYYFKQTLGNLKTLNFICSISLSFIFYKSLCSLVGPSAV